MEVSAAEPKKVFEKTEGEKLSRSQDIEVDLKRSGEKEQSMKVGHPKPQKQGTDQVISYLGTKLVSEIDYTRIKGLSRKKMGLNEVSEYYRYVLDAGIEGKLR